MRKARRRRPRMSEIARQCFWSTCERQHFLLLIHPIIETLLRLVLFSAEISRFLYNRIILSDTQASHGRATTDHHLGFRRSLLPQPHCFAGRYGFVSLYTGQSANTLAKQTQVRPADSVRPSPKTYMRTRFKPTGPAPASSSPAQSSSPLYPPSRRHSVDGP
jgi:hypothetical protein